MLTKLYIVKYITMSRWSPTLSEKAFCYSYFTVHLNYVLGICVRQQKHEYILIVTHSVRESPQTKTGSMVSYFLSKT